MIDKNEQMLKAERLAFMAFLLMLASAVGQFMYIASTYDVLPLSLGEFGRVAAYSFACGAIAAKVFEAKILRRVLAADNPSRSDTL